METVSLIEWYWLAATLIQSGFLIITTDIAVGDLRYVLKTKLSKRHHLLAWKNLIAEIVWVVTQLCQLVIVLLVMVAANRTDGVLILTWHVVFTTFVTTRLIGGALVALFRQKMET